MKLPWAIRNPGAAKLSKLLAADAKLAKDAGIHPMSDWWKGDARRYYLHPTAKVWVAQVGRGGVKSGTAAKVGAIETIAGPDVPSGERHYWAHLSENMAEASKTLLLFEAIFRALGVRFHRSGDIITLDDFPRGVIVRANRVGAVSGFRCFGFCADEVAKWNNEGSDPTEEVIASATAMTVTHPEAPKLIYSSPLGRIGYFNECVERGTDEHQVVSIAPTWVANPSVTEEQTRKLEPNPRIWSREYAAIPQADAGSVFEAGDTDRAFAAPAARIASPVLVLDPSSGKGDTFAYGVVGWSRRTDIGTPVLRLESIGGIEGRFSDIVTGAQVVARLASIAKARGITRCISDQRESLMLRAGLAAFGLSFFEYPWTAQNKPLAIERIRRLMTDGQLSLEPHDQLRRELGAFQERILPSGQITYSARRKGHDDYVALLVTGALADLDGKLLGSPLNPGVDWNWIEGMQRNAPKAMELGSVVGGMDSDYGYRDENTMVLHVKDYDVD